MTQFELEQMSEVPIRFKKLRVMGWRQFGQVDIELHPRLTVLTGANGAGKSTLLQLFSRHFGFNRSLLATPVLDKKGGYSYLTGRFSSSLARFWDNIWGSGQTDLPNASVGVIEYSNDVKVQLEIPDNAGAQYNINMRNQQRVPGIHIDSHQPISPFQQVGQIPTKIVSPTTAYSQYNNEYNQRFGGAHTGFSPMYRMKEAIIAMALFGEGNSRVRGNPEILQAYQGFIRVLRKILPESLGFIDLEVRPPEVVLVTEAGEFMVDAASGGLKTLIDLAWRLHLFSLQHDAFSVTIDEPENHLHPTMQRSLMPNLIDAFPSAQFIIATHSPFMVSAVKESNVYVLKYRKNQDSENLEVNQRYHERSRVESLLLDTVNKAGNASEVLREVLGVSATMPAWVEERLDAIIEKYRRIEITRESLASLRSELSELGYDEHYSEALAAISSGR